VQDLPLLLVVAADPGEHLVGLRANQRQGQGPANQVKDLSASG